MPFKKASRDQRLALQFKLDTRHPVDIRHLGRSLEALGAEYSQFAYARYGLKGAQLYVSRIKTGSIILTLLSEASFLVKHIDVFAGFVTHLNDIISLLLKPNKKEPRAQWITNQSVEHISTIVEPVAKDGGSNVTIKVIGNTGPVTINAVQVGSNKAKAIQNGARSSPRESVPMLIHYQPPLDRLAAPSSSKRRGKKSAGKPGLKPRKRGNTRRRNKRKQSSK